MPVTLKLSKRFYDILGQEVANELVDAMNAMDTSYRAEFRELFGAHFGQLRAEMDRLAVELRGEMARLAAELRGEMAELAARLRGDMDRLATELHRDRDKLATELRGDMDKLATELRGEMARLSTELRSEMIKLATELRSERKQQDTRIAAFQEKVGADLTAMKAELVGWMFRFWIGQIAVLTGLALAFKQFWG